MTKKDYNLIARAITDVDLSDADRRHVAHAMARALRDTNPRFDYDRFMRACYPPAVASPGHSAD